jgi:uncharacterized protein (DUF1697 family)
MYMPERFVALLRGINVGGHSLIKMSELKNSVENAGFQDVSTYINSGNIFFTSSISDEVKLARNIESAIEETFKLSVRIVVISGAQMQRIITGMPKGWGDKDGWKYNTLFLLPPYNIDTIIADIGTLKPDIEMMLPGDGVIFQAVEFKSFGRSTTGKLAANPVYKQMTIRNLNTTRKLLELMEKNT